MRSRVRPWLIYGNAVASHRGTASNAKQQQVVGVRPAMQKKQIMADSVRPGGQKECADADAM